MNLIIRIVLAVVIGMVVAGVLRYFNILTYGLDGLIGFLAGLAFFFGYDHYDGRRL